MGFFDEPTTADGPKARVEGIAKVTGKGKYAAEYDVPGVVHGVLVGSTVAAGTITKLHTEDAKAIPGVIDILSHLNRPEVPGLSGDNKFKFGLPIFYTDKIFFSGQPIALVVAETLEDAFYAASLVYADYTAEDFNTDFNKNKIDLKADGKERGTFAAWQNAAIQLESEYTIQNEVHSPMEMHATIAEWTASDKLNLYDKNQGVNGVQRFVGGAFGIPPENIHVSSEFVGGAFGSGLRVWPHTLAAVMAAKQLNKPVKVVLTRPQMFMMVGYRPQSWQRVRIGADKNGNVLGIHHQAKNTTSLYENFRDNITGISHKVYKVENLKTESGLVPLNMSTPIYMRGPGDCTGAFGIESAMDELSYKLNMDPKELRLKNTSVINDPDSGMPWSTNFLNECITNGAEKIGWENRNPVPGKKMEGDWKIGYGMALGFWNSGRQRTSTAIQLDKTGKLTVQCAITDIGTGTGTGMRNIAARNTGIAADKIKIELGDSDLPKAPSEGGSTGLASVGGAVVAACEALKVKLATYAANQNTNYKTVKPENITLESNGIGIKKDSTAFISFEELWTKNNLDTVKVEATAGPGDERKNFAFCSVIAHYCIVRVHSKTGKIKMHRMVSVADGGTIVNEKAAANQVIGANIGGIGMALMEEQLADNNFGRLVANDFAGYHFATNADAPMIEVSFIGKADPNISAVGSKGLGEVGLIGCAAAITNAIYNATGKRMRDLPVTPDKMMEG
jgi:xanthine dehydrogenase YagR molybdenum-binding subunit